MEPQDQALLDQLVTQGKLSRWELFDYPHDDIPQTLLIELVGGEEIRITPSGRPISTVT